MKKGYRLLRVFLLGATDSVVSMASLMIAFQLRMAGDAPDYMVEGLMLAVPVVGLVSFPLFYALGMYRRVWRYASVDDLLCLVRATTAAIVVTLLLVAMVGRLDWMPRSVPVIQWFVMIVLLSGARMGYRLASEWRRARARSTMAPTSAPPRPTLIIGPSNRVEIFLRLIATTRNSGYRPIGVLTDDAEHMELRLRGVPVLGPVSAFEDVVANLEAAGTPTQCVILADKAERLVGPDIVRLVTRAERLGLSVACLPDPSEADGHANGELDLRFIDLKDLLGRPQTTLDDETVRSHTAGRTVLVTGAGGTIGSELVRQIAALGPRKLILLDNCELNLYAIDRELADKFPNVPRTAVLCSIRHREAVMNVFAHHGPDLVFHAAALKHVPLVEENPCSGVLTNVTGTRNVADAAQLYGVRAMVQVSTDKAVNPIGFMGATKRLGELYCQALDIEGLELPNAPRFLTVRFGNVLGSSGSLIPLLQRQISRRAPITVTHSDIERYFMTVHEAVQLVLEGAACALGGALRRGRIFVLDMGEPIKIIDIARRLIRLAGLEPDVDIKINIIGLRAGEKLYEELFDDAETRLPSPIPGILQAEPNPVPLHILENAFDRLHTASTRDDEAAVRRLVAETLATSRRPPARPAEPVPAFAARALPSAVSPAAIPAE